MRGEVTFQERKSVGGMPPRQKKSSRRGWKTKRRYFVLWRTAFLCKCNNSGKITTFALRYIGNKQVIIF